MSKGRKKESIAKSKKKTIDKEQAIVRGSGFSYDEAKHATDRSQPIDHDKKEDIVILPNLGEPNRH